MKKIWCFALLVLVFLAMGICAAEVPDLLGKWTGSWNAYDKGIGFSNSTESESINFTFVEQKDRIFVGNLTYKQENGTRIAKDFSGAIDLDNKTLHIAESNGYTLGTIISNDEIELIHLEDGKNGLVAIDKLYRTK